MDTAKTKQTLTEGELLDLIASATTTDEIRHIEREHRNFLAKFPGNQKIIEAGEIVSMLVSAAAAIEADRSRLLTL